MMNRASALLGSAGFFVVAPGIVAGYVPWRITHWEIRSAFFDLFAVRAIGVVLLVLGSFALLESFVRFALRGIGTPAPILPTRRLVVTGLYRYVRNPMYLAVTAAIVGQGLILGQVSLLQYAAAVWLGFAIFVLAYEEPTPRRTFPQEYSAYAVAVPRWIPRLRPWQTTREYRPDA